MPEPPDAMDDPDNPDDNVDQDVATPWPDDWMTGSPARRCPLCGTLTGRPILFGLPTPETLDALERGEITIHLGGCTVPDEPVTHACTTCGHWYSPRETA